MVSPAHLGASCRRGLSFQRTRTWKASPDPDYEEKAARILELAERRPTAGVISFDQMGPVSLRPTPGAGWAPGGDLSGSGPTTTAAPAPATCSAPTTCTPTGCASGSDRPGAAATTSPS